MKELNNNLYSNSPKLIPIAILIIVLIFTLFSQHQMINSDSVRGFDAMKGYDWTGKFNTFLYYNPATRRLEEKFLTWWSPGQYLAPLLFMKLLHIKIGTSVTLVNFIGTLMGAIGYFLVFKRYGFSKWTLWTSVFLILFSSSILPRYYLYDGGDSLNFMAFPWILVFQKLLVNKYLKYVIPGLILFISFLCKLQMLIVVPLLLFMLIAANTEKLNYIFIWNKPFGMQDLKQTIKIYIPYILTILLVSLFIYFSFISRGKTPTDTVKQFSLNPDNFCFPIASPVTSIYFFNSLNTYLSSRVYLHSVYLAIISLSVLVSFLYLKKHFQEDDILKKKYSIIVLMLFLISLIVFMVLYVGGSSVDFNTRHFKLTSFLIYPILIEKAFKKFNRKFVWSLLAFFCLYGMINHLRLSKKWIEGTSVTRSGFRLTKDDLPLVIKEKLDDRIKKRTLIVSGYGSRYAIDNPLILPILRPVDPSNLNKSPYPVIFLDSLN